MTGLPMTQVAVRRLARDRTALFFVIVLPLVMIVIIGAMVRGFSI